MVFTGVMHARSLLMAAVLGLAVGAYGAAPAFDLCIDQSPAKAGRITPNSGTHRISANSVVAVAAEPQPGYQFAYWLGDVADPTARETTVQVSAPKVIVAVFTPAEKDPLEGMLSGGGGGMLTATRVDLTSPAWSPPGGGRRHTSEAPTIHTPEPATLALLALGGLVLRRRRR